jgi:hypothetical protein
VAPQKPDRTIPLVLKKLQLFLWVVQKRQIVPVFAPMQISASLKPDCFVFHQSRIQLCADPNGVRPTDVSGREARDWL